MWLRGVLLFTGNHLPPYLSRCLTRGIRSITTILWNEDEDNSNSNSNRNVNVNVKDTLYATATATATADIDEAVKGGE